MSPASLPFLDEAYLQPYFDIVAPLRGETPLDIAVPGGEGRLVVRSLGPFRVLEPAANGFADYMDLRYESPEAGRALLEAILARPEADLVVLRNVPGVSPTLGLAEQLARQRGWLRFSQNVNQAPYVELRGTWEAFHAGRRDRKSRYNLRRSARRLAEMGDLEIVHYTSPEEVDAYLDDAFRLYARRQQGLDSPWRFAGVVGRRFYRAVALTLARKGAIDLAFMRISGEPVAFAYSLRHEGVYYYFKVGVTDSPEILRFSPGAVLLEHLLEQAFADRLRRFDFMLGGEPYKAMWATGHDVVYTLVLARRRARATAAWLLYTARLRLRGWVRSSARRKRVAERLLTLLSLSGRPRGGGAR